MDDAVRQRIATYNRLKSDKNARLSHWQDLADYMAPHLAGITNPLSATSRPFATLFDGTGHLAAGRFADGLFSNLSPSQFLLSAPAGSKLEQDRTYTEFLADRTQALQLAMKQGNVETEIYNAYENLVLGNCCVSVKKGTKRAFSLSTRALTEYCFLEDEDHAVDTVFIERELSAYQAAQKWGISKLPAELQKSLKEATDAAYTSSRTYLNVQTPNQDWDPASVKAGSFPYTVLWLDPANQEDPVLQKQGVRRLRDIVARWKRPSGQPWGYGPADMASSWVKAIDKAMEIVLKYAARAMDPPSIWPGEASFWPMSTAPGTRIVGKMGAMDAGQPKFLEISADHRMAEWLFQYLSSLINECFMAQVFQTLKDDKQRTAREVAQIIQKDYDMAIPAVSRLRSEFFGPLIRLCLEQQTEYELGTYGWQYGGKKLPEYEYDLDLISPLGLAVRYNDLSKLDNLLVLNSQLAQIDPAVWDNYSLDEMSRGIGDSMGVPRSWRVSESARQDIRQKRQQMMARQQALEQTNLASQTAKNLSNPVDPNSPLARIAA
jgi:hypothetical protein